jgi:hypothetical protein
MIPLAFFAALQSDMGPSDLLQRSFELRSGWELCVTKYASDYAVLKESVDTLVDAAISKCSSLETDFRTVMANLTIDDKGSHFLPTYLDQIVTDERQKVRERGKAAILDARLSQSKVKH